MSRKQANPNRPTGQKTKQIYGISRRNSRPSTSSAAVRAHAIAIASSRPKTRLRQSLGQPARPTGSYMSKVTAQMLNPESSGDGQLVVAPDTAHNQVCVRHIHKQVDVSSDQLYRANGFKVVMHPDIFMPAYISASADALVPVAGLGGVGFEGSITTEPRAANPAGTASGYIKLSADGNSIYSLLSPIVDSAASTQQGLNMTDSGAAGQTVTYNIKDESSYADGTYDFIIFTKVAGGAWVTSATIHMKTHGKSSKDFTLPAHTVAIAFQVWLPDAGMYPTVQLGLSFQNVQFSTTGTNTLFPGFANTVSDENMTKGRVVSMSVRATNTSPDIANGGTISVGRVPHNFDVYGDIAAPISSLSSNRRYQGGANQGGYAFWIPASLDEFTVDDISKKRRAYRDSDYLVIQVKGWGNNGAQVSSFRLNFDWVVEFYTPNQLFEKVICPPMTDEFSTLWTVMQSIPAASCNPVHVEALKEGLKKGISLLRESAEFYGAHRSTIDDLVRVAFGLFF